MDELLELAMRWEASADRLRRRAGVVRWAATPDWQGPGADRCREQLVARWAALVELARQHDGVAHRLRGLAAWVETS